jgi:AcrR family transcriptional regulator
VSRLRVIDATIDLVVGHGYEALTLERIVERARTTFAELNRHFADEDDCCQGAFEEVCARFDRQLLPIYLRPDPWRERMRAAAYAAVRYCSDHEDEVRFAIAEQLRHPRAGAGERTLRLHLEQVDSVRWKLPDPEAIPATAAEFAIGCFIELLLRSHAEGDFGRLRGGIQELLYSVTDVYLGSEAAEEELALAPPAAVEEQEGTG